MVQNLRVMLGRAGFTEQEVATFRGVITALSKGRGRVLAKLAAAKAQAPSVTAQARAVPRPSTGEE